MPTSVTKRFIKCHNALIEKQIVKSSSMFAKAIGVHRQSVNRILQGEGEATISMLEAVIENFQVSPVYLMTGEGEIFQDLGNDFEPTIAYVPYKAFAGYSHQFQEDAFMKKIAALLFGMLLLASFAQAEPVKLTVLAMVEPGTVGADVFKMTVDDFKNSHPDIELEIEEVAHDPFHSKLQAMAVAKQLPDVFFLWPGKRTGYVTAAGLA